ncbi:MAG: ABC transporter permease [Planctomycetes bacterium]|nr:ABC transporter permease [Planctomycetota bacterium]
MAEAAAPQSAAATESGGASYWDLIWGQFRKNRLAMLSATVILLLFGVAAWAPVLANGRPIYWSEPGPGGEHVASWPLLTWLAAPTDEVSVDYLFNYFFFVTLAVPLLCVPVWWFSRAGAVAPKRARRRLLGAFGAALLVSFVPFLAPGMYDRAASTAEREDPVLAERLARLEKEYADGNLETEAYDRQKKELTIFREFRLWRPWRLDKRDYLGDYEFLTQSGKDVTAWTALVAHDPLSPTRKILHPPARYVRVEGDDYFVATAHVLKDRVSPGVNLVAFEAKIEGVDGDSVRLSGAPGVVVAGDEPLQLAAKALAGKEAWLIGRLLERVQPAAKPGEEPVKTWDLQLAAVRSSLDGLVTYRHRLGTDREGRDVLARMLHGARISISVGFVSVAISVLLGILIGGMAGYFRGWVDIAISRLIELMICIPTFFLILTILAMVEKRSIFDVMLIIGLTGWTGVARLVRGEFLKLAEQDFVQAARALGCSAGRVMFRHLLPNALGPVLVSAAFGVAGAVLTESSLSYLGFGAPPPTPTWGEMISQGKEFIEQAWWLLLFPGLSIFLTVTVYNLAGDGLRDAMDPRMRT